jgi:hypothetical protein
MTHELDNKQTGEIMSLERAHFLDRLEPVYEQQWDELLKSAAETRINLTDFAIPLWKDNTIPTAIRDRAMLLIVGSDPIGKWEGSWSMQAIKLFGGGFHLGYIKGSEDEFSDWLDEALSYGDIIDHETLYRLSYTYFTNGNWSQERFEQTLDQFDPIVQSTWHDPYDGYQWSMPALPYISDIRSNKSVDKSNTKMKQWADEKYDLYAQNCLTNEKVLPSWLRNLRPVVIQSIAIDSYKKCKDEVMLPPNIVAIYEEYCHEIFSSSYIIHTDRGGKFMKHIGEFSQRVILAYLEARYEESVHHSSYLTESEEQTLLSYIDDPLPQKIIEHADRLKKQRTEIEKQQAKQKIQDDIKRTEREVKYAIEDRELQAKKEKNEMTKQLFRLAWKST